MNLAPARTEHPAGVHPSLDADAIQANKEIPFLRPGHHPRATPRRTGGHVLGIASPVSDPRQDCCFLWETLHGRKASASCPSICNKFQNSIPASVCCARRFRSLDRTPKNLFSTTSENEDSHVTAQELFRQLDLLLEIPASTEKTPPV